MDLRTDTELGHATWDAVRRHLEAKRRPVEDEIRRYPAPIAGCDAHFNYLLEQRSALSRELVRLDAAAKAAGGGPAGEKDVEAFLRASTCIDAETAERLLAGARLPV